MNPFRAFLYAIRRVLLKKLVPEIIWPRNVDIDGVTIPVRGTSLNFGTKRWISNGLYERDERLLVSAIVQPGMTVVEMGGSLGILARVLAHRVGPEGRVISLEASFDLFQKAKTWCPIPFNLEFVHGFAFPLWESSSVKVTGFKSDGSELDGRASWNFGQKSLHNNWDLNKISKSLNVVPDVLVVDIEGGEEVLRQITPNFPKRTSHIILEFHPNRYGQVGVDEIITCLGREGFQVAEVSGPVTRFSRSII
jgi:FkbM family methyltransferase